MQSGRIGNKGLNDAARLQPGFSFHMVTVEGLNPLVNPINIKHDSQLIVGYSASLKLVNNYDYIF